jgi:Ser/Thr protein kinase RdoA (MazF antagonist)
VSFDSSAAVAEAFALGRVASPPVFVARGAMGEIWKLMTDTGAWAVKVLFDWGEAPARPSDVDMQLAALGAGIALPRPIVTADDRAVVAIDGTRYRAYEWADLDPPVPRPAPPARAAEAGTLLGRLHQLGVPTDGEVDDWYTVATPATALSALGERAVAEGRPWAGAFVATLPAVERLRPFVPDDHGPARCCHRDFEPPNVLPAAGGGPLVVLDWENAGPLPPDAELAAALHSWCAGGGVARRDSAQAFLAGYRSAGGDAQLDPDRSWSMAVSTAVNFLAVMAEQAMADDEHRAFAERQLHALCHGDLDDVLASIETFSPLFG